jgi:radical SAM protein with 4Fe4S-binding SPASM domain
MHESMTSAQTMLSTGACHPRCHIPWQQMVIDADGTVNPCCYWSAYGNLNPACGNLNETPLLEIWNGPAYQNLRQNMARGDLAAAGCADCLTLRQGNVMGLQFDPDADREAPPASPYARNLQIVREEVARGAAVLQAKPTILSLTASYACNFRCIHCYQDAARGLRIRREAAVDEVLELVPVLDQIIPGGGEPLFDPLWRRFLRDADVSSNPYLQLATTTNASLVSDDILAGLARFKALNVSLDGGSKSVFENVRRNGRWEQVVGNIDRMIELARRKGPPSIVSVTMSVMKANFRDIPNLVTFAMQRGITFGLSPVVSMPVDQSLTCFNDPAAETAGWREALREAEARFQALSSRGPNGSPAEHTHFRVLEQCVPWEILERHHEAVEGSVPERILRNCRKQFHRDVLVGFYPVVRRRLEQCRYYAPLTGDRYRVSLPEGEYALGFFPRNLYASPLPSYRVRVVLENGRGRLETIRLPLPGSSALKAVKTAFGRILPDSSKRMLKRLLVRS